MRARLLLVALLLLAGCASAPKSVPIPVTLTHGSSTLRIDARVASTPADRNRGLMGVRSLARGAGMLFVFPTTVQVAFYMKDTFIPLDIAFIAGERVVEVRSMRPCTTSPCPLTTSSFPYEQALEVSAGVFDRAGIRAGASVEYGRELPEAS
jgi:uncharacterized membrane protein (UPF0127 family)